MLLLFMMMMKLKLVVRAQHYYKRPAILVLAEKIRQ